MLFLDPVQEESAELVKLAELFYKHKIPLRLVLAVYGPLLAFVIFIRMWVSFYLQIEYSCLPFFYRIGFVFVVNTEDEIDGFSDAGVAFYRLLNYIAEEYDLSQALMSMLSVSVSHT